MMPASSPMVTTSNRLHYFTKNDPHACGSCGPSYYTFTRTTCFDDDNDDNDSGDDDYYNYYYYYYGDKTNYYKNLTDRTSQTQRVNDKTYLITFILF